MNLPDGPTGLALFADAVRGAGVRVSTGDLVVAGDALRAAAPATPTRCYWVLRATLRIPPDQLAAFDALFDAWVLGIVKHEATPAHEDPRLTNEGGATADGADEDGATWSVHERLRTVRLEDMDDDQLDLVDRLLDRVWTHVRQRPARRRRPTSRAGELDLRRTSRAAWRLGGEPLVLHRRRRQRQPRRLVLLLDVSGSMAALTRPLLHLAHLARRADGRAEAFVFGTQLSRVTQQLEPRRRFDPQVLTDEPRDWGGGTRTGAALADLRSRWAPRGIVRGSTVVVVSDGLDGGDVDRLGEEMARLARTAHRVVWASPLLGGPGYRPVQRALRAALPHVDELVSVRTFEDLEAMARRLGNGGVHGRARRPETARAAAGATRA